MREHRTLAEDCGQALSVIMADDVFIPGVDVGS